MTKELKIGLLAFVTFVFVIWGYVFVKGENLFSNNLTFHTYYNNVKDLTVAGPVMVNGMNIGTVKSIDLDPNDVDNIKVTFSISNKIKIPNNTVATLKSLNPIGGKFIELNFDKMCDGTNCAQEGQELKGVAIGLIGSMVDMEEASAYGDALSVSLGSTIKNLGNADSEATLDKTLVNLERVTDNLTGITSKLDKLLSSSQKDLSKTMNNLSSISTNLADNNAQITEMIGNMNKMSKQLASVDLNTTMTKTNTTVDQAAKTLQGIESTMTQLNATIAEFESVAKKINNGEGSLSKLLNDKALYNNMEETSAHLSLLLQDVRLNPKRYVNVSVFGKKDKAYTKPEDDPGIKGN